MKNQEGMKKHDISRSQGGQDDQAYMAHVGEQWDQDKPRNQIPHGVRFSTKKFRLYSKAVAQKTIPQKSHVVRFQFQKDHTLVEWSGARPERETNGLDGSAAEQLGKLAWGVCRHRFDACKFITS